jgi:hypothetical protein
VGDSFVASGIVQGALSGGLSTSPEWVFAPARLSDPNPSKVFASHSPATHMAEIWHRTKGVGVNNRVGIKLAGCLAPDGRPTDCREVVLGETERDRRNRLGKENFGAARRNRAMLGWYHDQRRPTNLCGPRNCRVGGSTRGVCEVFGSTAIAVLGGHRRAETGKAGR